MSYENDSIDSKDRMVLTVKASLAIKRISNLIACNSWLVANIALLEIKEAVADIEKSCAGKGEGK